MLRHSHGYVTILDQLAAQPGLDKEDRKGCMRYLQGDVPEATQRTFERSQEWGLCMEKEDEEQHG